MSRISDEVVGDHRIIFVHHVHAVVPLVRRPRSTRRTAYCAAGLDNRDDVLPLLGGDQFQLAQNTAILFHVDFTDEVRDALKLGTTIRRVIEFTVQLTSLGILLKATNLALHDGARIHTIVRSDDVGAAQLTPEDDLSAFLALDQYLAAARV